MKMRTLILLATLFALPACVADQASEDLASSRKAWQAHEPARYSYTVRTVCFCPPESVRVVATRDSVIEARNYLPFSPGVFLGCIPCATLFHRLPILAKLEALRGANPYKLTIKFNPEYAFPETVDYDGSKNAVDDEFSQVITDFRPEATPLNFRTLIRIGLILAGVSAHAGTLSLDPPVVEAGRPSVVTVSGHSQFCAPIISHAQATVAGTTLNLSAVFEGIIPPPFAFPVPYPTPPTSPCQPLIPASTPSS